MRNTWINISLLNFLIATLMGLMLRYAFIGEIPGMDYRNMLHGHSHVAMLGWVYLILFTLLHHYFIPEDKKKTSFYNRLFWFTQATVFGMMVSFPIQGYGAVSIIFSTLHIIASYILAYWLWKDLSAANFPFINLLVKASLVAMVFSTIGIWGMGPVMAMGLRNTSYYHLTVQFYLHFQFNGWFVLAVIALLVQLFQSWGIIISPNQLKGFLNIYLISLGLTFFHVLNWAFPQVLYLHFNSVGVILQVLAFGYLLWPIWNKIREKMRLQAPILKVFFHFGLLSLVFKLLFQVSLIVPDIANISTTIRQFMIGYIHLTMLGFITGWLLWVLAHSHSFGTMGAAIFITGYVGTEVLLFVQGVFFWAKWGSLPYYHEILFLCSALLPLGLGLMVLTSLYQRTIPKYNHINT
ncbi:hypothetical protein KI659_10655 [Litoribacter alkaliphilus]|uniref:Uncharacterized protein n=1 Tax=Litoribacter ruber TaxID=702568 RepID=A0AAP2CL03_9BACT|nr:hypothetical protein [Litoribacter alkaliphilus]MBS9524475.1 hypothetical protein [Litoribacter alkaliphilus]